ncbi:MAG: hypothetical protein JWO36_6570 [Myxococcales bacterium]|nr:hypothetical protein [Myxococcales bacterium]
MKSLTLDGPALVMCRASRPISRFFATFLCPWPTTRDVRQSGRMTEQGFTLIEMMVVVAIIAILCGLAIGINGRTYGANAESVSDQLVSVMNLAKMRAVSSRRWQRVEVQPTRATLWQWGQAGMTVPAGSTCPACWELVQISQFPNGAKVWDVSSTVYVASGASVTQNSSLDFAIDFRPDGSSTGGTVFVTDLQHAHTSRVVVYHATGSSYARTSW